MGLAITGSSACDGGAASAPPMKAQLPCEVAPVVEKSCLSCHGEPPTSGAPQSLLTVEQWRARSQTDPAASNGELALRRMTDPVLPMPPEGLLSDDEISAVRRWVEGGLKGGACVSSSR